MATIPTSAAPAPAPATLATATRRRGEMNFSLRRLNEPLEFQQVALDPTWNKFKTVMVFVGGILFFLVFGTMMFILGVVGSYRSHPSTRTEQTHVEQSVPSPTPLAPIVAQPTPLPRRELSPEERAEQYKEERRRQYGVR